MRVVWKKIPLFSVSFFLTVTSDLYHQTSTPTQIGARWFRVSGLSTVTPICILAAVLNVIMSIAVLLQSVYYGTCTKIL